MKNRENKTIISFMRKSLILVLLLSAILNSYGQSKQTSGEAKTEDYCPHEVSLWGLGGLSTLMYSPTFGESSMQFGLGFGLGYTYFFHRNFGVMLGGELAFYNARMQLDDLTDRYPAKDGDKEDILYSTTIKDYEEYQRLMNLNIPIMFQYQGDGEHKFYAGLGFKLGIPLTAKYEVSEGGKIKASGFYNNEKTGTLQELFDQPDLGYGDFAINKTESDLDFNLAYIGFAEAGVKWRLSGLLSLYTGLYVEYGFNDVAKTHTNNFVAYNEVNPSNPNINSVLTGEYTENGETESFVSRVSPFGLGLKLRLGFNPCSESKPKEAPKPKPAPAPKPAPTPAPAPAPAPPPPPVQQEVAPPPAPAPAPVVVPEEQSSRAKARAIIAARAKEEVDERPLVISKDQVDAEAKYGKIRKAITVELVYAKGSSTLSEAMQERMNNAIANIRSEYGDEQVSIICEGHTCDLGSFDLNMSLAQKRADGVRDYLKKKGGFTNVESASEGPRKPLVPNDSEENRMKNRRVVLIVR
jgi:outer membrane protein OmpA-like peptidoglycan-associated protein